MSVNNKIIANPSLLQIGFSIFGMLFFLSMAYLVYDPELELYQKSDYLTMWIIIAIFSLFSIACFYMLLCSRKVELTNEYLLITYPLLFQSKKINLDDVKKVSEGNYNVKSSHDFKTIEVYTGRKITIELFDAKKIVITSFEMTNYEILAKNLKNVTTSYFKLYTGGENTKNNQGYGWLLFIMILTFGLIISLIRKN